MTGPLDQQDDAQTPLSEEEREGLTQYMESLGPMRLSEVEIVQLQIVNKFRAVSGDDTFV